MDSTVIWLTATHTLIEPAMVQGPTTDTMISNTRTLYEEDHREEEAVDTEDVNLLHIHGLIISIPIAIRLGLQLQSV